MIYHAHAHVGGVKSVVGVVLTGLYVYIHDCTTVMQEDLEHMTWEHRMKEEEGMSLADAERIVELNLSIITERLHQTSALKSCTSTSDTKDSMTDQAAAYDVHTLHNLRCRV